MALSVRSEVYLFLTFKESLKSLLDSYSIRVTLQDLRIPPGNRLEKLAGDRAGQHSIRINNQWRICFVWRQENAYDVEIVDYH